MANCGVPLDCSYIDAFVAWNNNASAPQPPPLPQNLADPDISGIGVNLTY